MQDFHYLKKLIENDKIVYIQTHDFPDHDAVGAAFGFQHLLEHFSIKAQIVYEGNIQRNSLLEFIAALEIPIHPASQYRISETDKIIIVDGCKGNQNVTDLMGKEVAVIDHHQSVSPDDVPYADIRSGFGSCSTMVYSYYAELNIEIPFKVATALLAGLLMDTSLMLRGVCETDLEAHSRLYHLADNLFVNRNLRNSIQVKDLCFYKSALERVIIRERIAFCYFDDGCNQNLLGIIGDFFLTIKEVEFVFLCARNSHSINFSLRSENPQWNSAHVIQEILKGTGFGGGHSEMAGGIIQDYNLFNEKEIYSKLYRKLLNKSYELPDHPPTTLQTIC